MLVIQIALGVVLAFIIIKFFLLISKNISDVSMFVFTPVFKIIDFFDDLLNGPARKQKYEKEWKIFHEQRKSKKMKKHEAN